MELIDFIREDDLVELRKKGFKPMVLSVSGEWVRVCVELIDFSLVQVLDILLSDD